MRLSTTVAILCFSFSAEAFSTSTSSLSLHRLKSSPSLHPSNSRFFNNFNVQEKQTSRSTSAIQMSLGLRGGSSIASTISSSPTSLFNANLLALALTTAFIKVADRISSKDNGDSEEEAKPAAIKSLQIRFLSVFWLLRCADWLQGPYFYEVYSSKIFNGIPASLATVSKLFLTGFASTALFGPIVGRLSDSKGRKRGTLAFALLYSLGAASTKSNILGVLLMGRVLSGIGTSLLFSAPESWLVGEAMSKEKGGQYLGETFGMVSSST